MNTPVETSTNERNQTREDQNKGGDTKGGTNTPVWPQSPWVSTRSTPVYPARFLAMLGAAEKKKATTTSTPDFLTPPPPIPEDTEEDDECYRHFEKLYEEECQEVEEVDLGPDFVYPTQRAFDKFIGEFDFMKHLKHGTLTKFDGTVRGYPTFKRNFLDWCTRKESGIFISCWPWSTWYLKNCKRRCFMIWITLLLALGCA